MRNLHAHLSDHILQQGELKRHKHNTGGLEYHLNASPFLSHNTNCLGEGLTSASMQVDQQGITPAAHTYTTARELPFLAKTTMTIYKKHSF